MTRQQATSAVWNILSAASVLGFASAAWMQAPEIEGFVAPVLTAEPERTTVTRAPGGDTVVDLWLHKRRPCRFMDQSFLVGNDHNGWRRVAFSRPVTVEGAPRPVGLQSFGLYVFDTGRARVGDYVRGVLWYECHDGWYSPAPVGPWAVPALP